jgi:hypothetical protein
MTYNEIRGLEALRDVVKKHRIHIWAQRDELGEPTVKAQVGYNGKTISLQSGIDDLALDAAIVEAKQ